MTKSISLVLMRTESLMVKLSVTLLDGKDTNAVYSIYETDMYDYVTVNLAAYVTIQYKPKMEGNVPWDPSRVVRVNEMSMFTLLRGMKDFYNRYQREDLFTYYKQRDQIDCNALPSDKVTIALINNQFIELTPDVITDPVTNAILPGIIMKLNNTDNKIALSSDEFEALLYRLTQLNIPSEAMSLVSLAMSMTKEGKTVYNADVSQDNNAKKTMSRTNIFQRKEEAMKVDSVIDKRITTDTPSSLDDL